MVPSPAEEGKEWERPVNTVTEVATTGEGRAQSPQGGSKPSGKKKDTTKTITNAGWTI